MTYEEQIKALFSRIPSYQMVGDRAYKPGVETMMSFDAAMGHPHTNFKVVHVAGTNGKGSVSSMMAAALSAAGHKVGLYTSPHLLDFRERMKIVEKGEYRMVTEEYVSSFLERWKDFVDTENPSFFELTTAMALSFFSDEGVEYAVIETGLGGRLDSTNVVTPVISIITNIGLEHCLYLGHTIAEIAGEKAGIIKEGIPVVVGHATVESLPVFQRVAYEKDSSLVLAQEYDTAHWPVIPDYLDLKGLYQDANLRTVIAALDEMKISPAPGIVNAIEHSAAITGLHGRWESIRNHDEARAEIICDIGHNAHGLRLVFEQLRGLSSMYDRIYIVFGVVSDKDVDAVAPLMIKPSTKYRYIFTQPSTQRAMPVEELLRRMAPYGIEGDAVPSVAQAVTKADRVASGSDLIFIGGSNFTVADALTFLKFV